MPQKPCGRGVLALVVVNRGIEFETPFLALLLVLLDVFGPDPAVDLGTLFTAVPDAHLVDFLGLRVVDDRCAGGEIATSPFQAASVLAIAIPSIFVPLADLIIYGGDKVLDIY